MQESLATLVLIASLIAFCIFVLTGYRASSRGTYNKRAVAAFILLVLLLVGMRMLVECFWAHKCSLQGVWPNSSSIDNGWVEFLVIIVGIGMMMVYAWLVAAGYALLPILAASLTGVVVGRVIWSLRQRKPLPCDNEGKPISSLNKPIKKPRFGRKSE
ncbi:hypothetical protein [Rhizobium sp. BG4]|uniref:hypothetical protein n=1 Tax=Rhizobium sp. BG4 TaxID=2613770 RepID=UPI00193CF50F|nr:hypothetical protein [Rhizobium sp. BG4]QRM42677.1 hypothetical protein F2982_04115 [Rhizobium sp. BG4]